MIFPNLAGQVALHRLSMAQLVTTRIFLDVEITQAVRFAVLDHAGRHSAKLKTMHRFFLDSVADKHPMRSLMRHVRQQADGFPLSARLLQQFGQHLRNRLTRPR